MFQPLIDQAHDMIQRLHICAEKGRDHVPPAVAIRYSEFEAWETAANGIVATVFGADTAEAARWHALGERRAALVGDARRNDMKRGEFFGLIDYFHLGIGVLREFQAGYQYYLSTTSPAAPPGLDARADRAPADAHEQLAPYSQNGRHAGPQVDIRAENNRWDIMVSLSDSTYYWLSEMAASREPAGPADRSAVSRLATTIIERVAVQTQRSKEQSASGHSQSH